MSQILYQASPVMFKNRPFSFILVLILSLVGVGLIVFLVWWLKCKGEVITVSEDKVSKRTGILSKHTNDVYHEDIRNIQVYQSMFQRMFGVGSIAIASAGTDGVEIAIDGIPNPDEVKLIIEEQRRARKAEGTPQQ